ncbi:MAG: 3-keto-5-aminohexanoate cleavage protein [Anaerolineales bacterium]|nr:3-keto-5-aminohexanoate cleavage protein [Anaerolineales bacterium]
MPTRNVIITAAVTGASFTPTMSPFMRFDPDEVIADAVAAAKAGAAIIHIHARDPQDGRPTSDPGIFRAYASGIKAETDAIINMTTGGATGQTIEERLNVVKMLQPELCSCNLGTMNYGGFPMIPKYEGQWRFEWEREFLESTRTEPFTSSFADIEYMLKTLQNETGTRMEFEAYDVGHLYTLAYYASLGLVQPPIMVQMVMNTLGGVGPDIDNVVFMVRTAQRLLGNEVEIAVLGGGRYQFDLITVGALMGCNVRVGMEDNLYIRRGKLAESNAEYVEKARRIFDELGLKIGSAEEARGRFGLKGGGNVRF